MTSKKSSRRLDREIASHLAAERDVIKSRHMGSRAVHDLLARVGFEVGIDRLTTKTGRELMQRDAERMPIDPDAWMEGWTRTAKGEREDARRSRIGQPHIPLAGLDVLFRR